MNLLFYTKNIVINMLLDFSPSIFRFDIDSQQLFIQNMAESFKTLIYVQLLKIYFSFLLIIKLEKKSQWLKN